MPPAKHAYQLTETGWGRFTAERHRLQIPPPGPNEYAPSHHFPHTSQALLSISRLCLEDLQRDRVKFQGQAG